MTTQPTTADFSGDMSYHPLAELRMMDLAQIEALFEGIPTERRGYYARIYGEQVLNAGAIGNDRDEYEAACVLLKIYEDVHKVPVGARWITVPQHVIDAVTLNEAVVSPESSFVSAKPSGMPSPVAMVAFGVAMVAALAFVLLPKGGHSTTSVALLASLTPSATATAQQSATPTPIAIENVNDTVNSGTGGGSNSNTSCSSTNGASFPVKLTISQPGIRQPRVYVVQQRAIKVSDWKYSDDPGTASYIDCLTVRPILGIPYSVDNAALFDGLTVGSKFQMVTNTGATLTFDFSSRTLVQRTDTSVFGQSGPGIILLLIGEHDKETGTTTQFRVAVTGSYNPIQELSDQNVISVQAMQAHAYPTATPTVSPTPIRRTTLQLIGVHYTDRYLEVQARLINVRDTPITITGDMIWLVLGYAAGPRDPRVPCDGMQSFTILPGQAADLDVYFKYNGEPFASFGIGQNDEWKYDVQVR